MQRLITIYLDNQAYSKGKFFSGDPADKHGFVEDHLQDYLQQGWAIKAIHGFGGAAETFAVRGWIVALLEK
jgi:hypothetical protein